MNHIELLFNKIYATVRYYKCATMFLVNSDNRVSYPGLVAPKLLGGEGCWNQSHLAQDLHGALHLLLVHRHVLVRRVSAEWKESAGHMFSPTVVVENGYKNPQYENCAYFVVYRTVDLYMHSLYNT